MKKVRRFTCDNYHVIYCRECWNAIQEEDDGYFLKSVDWVSDIAMSYECGVEDTHGTPQEAVWN